MRAIFLWCAAAAVLLSAGPAAAAPADDAVRALTEGSLYVQPDAQNGYGKAVSVDPGRVGSALGSTVKVAIFTVGANGDDAVTALTRGVRAGRVLVVFVGAHYEVRYRSCPSAPDAVRAQIAAHTDELRAGQYTDALLGIGSAVRCRAPASSSAFSGAASGTAGHKSNGAGLVAAMVGIVGVLGVAAVIGGIVWGRKRRRRTQQADARASITPFFDRLASEVNMLDPGENQPARQALADASERYTSAGGQMATAETPVQWAAVRRTVLEGLQAAQAARRALGIDPGPDLPPIDTPRGPQLTQERTVDVGGQQYRGYPAYTPGAPHYFAGGGGYLGGWYTFPFWETLLIGSALGGGWGFGGFDSGYASGYDSGYAAGDDAGNDGSGDWSDGSGGDVGGAGDWGGGGDFGGGDFGGGGDGGSF